LKIGFFVAQKYFFDNSKPRFTANSKLTAFGGSNSRICDRYASTRIVTEKIFNSHSDPYFQIARQECQVIFDAFFTEKVISSTFESTSTVTVSPSANFPSRICKASGS